MPSDSTDKSLLTLAEAARYVKLSVSTIRRYVKNGRLPFVLYAGSHPRFRKADIDQWLRGDNT